MKTLQTNLLLLFISLTIHSQTIDYITIEGRAYDSRFTGSGIPFIEVRLYDPQDMSEPQAVTETDENGYYSAAFMIISDVNDEFTPGKYNLRQNYPNPFNPTTTISYDLPKESTVKLKVFNSIGKEIRMLVDKRQKAGRYTINFDGSDLASGVYYYSLTADNYREVKKMILLK